MGFDWTDAQIDAVCNYWGEALMKERGGELFSEEWRQKYASLPEPCQEMRDRFAYLLKVRLVHLRKDGIRKPREGDTWDSWALKDLVEKGIIECDYEPHLWELRECLALGWTANYHVLAGKSFTRFMPDGSVQAKSGYRSEIVTILQAPTGITA